MKKIIAIALISSLSACSTIVNGTKQNVTVDTVGIKGAKCTLKNKEGTWKVADTPNSVEVARSSGALRVKCNKGHLRGESVVDSQAAGMVAGNVIAGGVIGAGVDIASGAAFNYPQTVYVPMKGKVASK